MTHLNRMREHSPQAYAPRVTRGPVHSDTWMQIPADVSGLRIELLQIEETGCFGAVLAARIGTGVYHNFSGAQYSLQHPACTLLLDATAYASYQRKHRQHQNLITVLQGYHTRIREHG